MEEGQEGLALLLIEAGTGSAGPSCSAVPDQELVQALWSLGQFPATQQVCSHIPGSPPREMLQQVHKTHIRMFTLASLRLLK